MTDYNKLYETFKERNKKIALPKPKPKDKDKDKEKDKEKEPNIQTRNILYNNKTNYGKIVEKNNNFNDILNTLRGPNILKIHKLYQEKINNKDYNLIIMEKAVLGNIGKFFDFLGDQYKNLSMINNPFPETISDNVLRFFATQIVKGLETLEESEIVHFNIKPENLLISLGLKLKISGFSYAKKLKKGLILDNTCINNKCYHTPESCQENKVFDIDTAKKQDYYSLGATLFLLKLGSQMLDYNEYAVSGWSEDRVIDLLQRDIAHLQSFPLFDNNFVDFICSLLAYIPEERPNFEEIYRNKWLNERSDEIELVYRGFFEEKEETKTMVELMKSDFLIEKKSLIENNNEENCNKEKNNKEKNNKKRRNFKFIPKE